MVLTIPEMHKHLDDLNQFYSEKTSAFVSVISSHPGKLTSSDVNEFSELIEEIRNDALTRISEYFHNKLQVKCSLYDSEVHIPQLRLRHILNQDNLSNNN
jgi:hypothetical protein